MFLVLYKYDNWIYAEVMKLVDVLDSKSCVGNHVPVRVRPSAYRELRKGFFLFGADENHKAQSFVLGSSVRWLRAKSFCGCAISTLAKLVDPLNATEQDSPAFGK